MSISRDLVLFGAVGLTIIGMTDCLLAQATHSSEDWSQYPAIGNMQSVRSFQKPFYDSIENLKNSSELQQPLKLTARVTAESRTGIRRLTIRSFQILSDGDRSSAEFELGAGSWPSVVGALGSAVAGDYLMQATIRNISIDQLEIVFTSTPGRAKTQGNGPRVTYPRNLAYIAFIVSDATEEQLEDLKREVERVSPVLKLVSESQPIDHGVLSYTQTAAAPGQKTLGGLREFLEDKRLATEGAVPPEGRNESSRRSRTDWRPPLRAHIKVEGETGIRHIRTDLRNFQVLHDYPRYLAGHNLGPIPEEHILGTMITCLTHIYEIEAAKKGIPLDKLELDVEGTLTTRLGNIDTSPTYKDIRYGVQIASPEPLETIQTLQRAVEATCPIYNMLKDSQPIKGTIIRGPYSEEKEKQATE